MGIKDSNLKKPVLTFGLVLMAGIYSAYADGIETGLTSAASSIKGYITAITALCYAIGGVVGIVGGVRIFNKWQGGDRDINKEVMAYGGALIFLLLAPTVVKAIFSLS